MRERVMRDAFFLSMHSNKTLQRVEEDICRVEADVFKATIKQHA